MEEEFNLSIAFIVFFADALYWFLTVFLIDKVIDHHALKAGFYAAALNFNSYLAVFYFVKNFDYLAPACFGAFIGAALATEYDRRKSRNNGSAGELAELKKEIKKIKDDVDVLKGTATIPKKVVKIS